MAHLQEDRHDIDGLDKEAYFGLLVITQRLHVHLCRCVQPWGKTCLGYNLEGIMERGG